MWRLGALMGVIRYAIQDARRDPTFENVGASFSFVSVNE